MRLDYYVECAETWAPVLAALVPPGATIVEPCAGWAPKIALALTRTGFSGRLVAVDRAPEALDAYVELARVIAPRFAIETHVGDCERALPAGDVAVLNHVYDDLLLGRLGAESPFLAPGDLDRAWDEVEHHRADWIPSIALGLSTALARFELVLSAHYEGYQEALHGRRRAFRLGAELEASVVAHLERAGYTRLDVSRRLPPDPYFPATALVALTRGPRP